MHTDEPQSTLTHTLPLLSHQFRQLSTSDGLWLSSLKHLISHRSPSRWIDGLLHLLNDGRVYPPWSTFYRVAVDKNDYILADKVRNLNAANNNNNNRREIGELVTLVCESFRCTGYSNNEYHGDNNDADNHHDHPTMVEETCHNHHHFDNDDDDNNSPRRNQKRQLQQQQHRRSIKDIYLYLIKNFVYITLPLFHIRSCQPPRHCHRGDTITHTFIDPLHVAMMAELMTIATDDDGTAAGRRQRRRSRDGKPLVILAYDRRRRRQLLLSSPTKNEVSAAVVFKAKIMTVKKRQHQGGIRICVMMEVLTRVTSSLVSLNESECCCEAKIKRF